MRFITWNVNGLRACIQKGFWEFYKAVDADFFCIQETKMHSSQFTEPLDCYQYWNNAEKKGYSGTAIFTRHRPIQYRIVRDFDNEGRIIALEYTKFFLVNAYVPNSQKELARLDYRMNWENGLADFLLSLNKPVIYCGDLNVAHKEIDLKHPKANRFNAGFTEQERGKLTQLLDKCNLTDAYRYLYPDKADAYTWWSYMRNARANNAGWRIDYFLVSKQLQGGIRDVVIHSNVFGSDHCPVELNYTVPDAGNIGNSAPKLSFFF
ncbi:MAG: exodeoxyribonuclease III [Oscillospiraceae bacterium]|jgi:exodeoxyribonuclease-3|nr:exodeoxyribonuclease III [Oscillospiraceae bacterium]